MSKKKIFQPPVTQRFGTPPIRKGDKGGTEIMCPFCNPSHVLTTQGPAACGTQLQVRAVQTVYDARHNKSLVCVKCHKGGGKMVQFNNSMIHTPDCTPGVVTFIEKPQFSILANLVYHLPTWARARVEPWTGRTEKVDEITPEGERTGRVMGYVFYRITNG